MFLPGFVTIIQKGRVIYKEANPIQLGWQDLYTDTDKTTARLLTKQLPKEMVATVMSYHTGWGDEEDWYAILSNK